MKALLALIDSPLFRASRYLRQTLLSPICSGLLLLALVATPEPARLALLRRLSPTATFDPAIAKTVLQVLLGLGIVSRLNGALNSMAANAGRVTAADGWNWPDELAVVTGGCSGIGLGVVERLARRGVKVAVIDVRDLPKSLSGHPLVHFYRCDITSPKSVAETADAIRRDLGHPSILINNAGITRPLSILDMPEDVLRDIFNVNCLSHWSTVKQFLPRMIQLNKGHVVTIASMASFIALAKGADYSATKAGALSFHEALTTELKSIYKTDGVLTSVVHPNFVRTPLVEGFCSEIERAGFKLLDADHVSDEIAAQVFSRRGGQLVIPRHQSLISGLRAWPTWLQVYVRDTIAKSATNI